MKIVVLALGKKALRLKTGALVAHPEWIETIHVAMRYVQSLSRDHEITLVLSGGETVPGCVSEARYGQRLLEEEYASGVSNYFRVLLEEGARTTPENIIFTQLLLCRQSMKPDILVVVGRVCQIPRVTVIVQKVWKYGAPDIMYLAVPDNEPWWRRILETVFLTALSHIDPRGRSFIYTLLKKRRNG